MGEKLDPYRPAFQGLDVDKFLAEMKYCFQELLEAAQTYPTGVELSDDRIPGFNWQDTRTRYQQAVRRSRAACGIHGLGTSFSVAQRRSLSASAFAVAYL